MGDFYRPQIPPAPSLFFFEILLVSVVLLDYLIRSHALKENPFAFQAISRVKGRYDNLLRDMGRQKGKHMESKKVVFSALDSLARGALMRVGYKLMEFIFRCFS